MKTTLLLLLFPFLAFSQSSVLPVDASGNISYEEVVDVDSALKADHLYGNALKWFAKNFNSPKDVIQLQIPETRTITAQGITHTKWVNAFNGDVKALLNFKLTLDFKDGRYKYLINEVILNVAGGDYPGMIEEVAAKKKKYSIKAVNYINKSIQDLVASMKAGIVSAEIW